MMTGDSRPNKHRSDLLLELRRRTPLMQDKAVQSSYDESQYNGMDDSTATGFDNVGNDIAQMGHDIVASNDIVSSRNDNLSSRNDIVSPVTSRNDIVSPVTSQNDVPSVTVAEINSPSADDPSRSNGPASPIYSRPFHQRSHDSEDSGLVDECLCMDGVDSATLEMRPKHFMGSQKADSDAVDEIKEQMPSVLGNNVYKEQKLKEQFETKDDANNCALDCLAFTLECCQCVIL